MPARLRPDPVTVARLHLLAAQAATDDEAREFANQLRAHLRGVRAAQWEPYPWQHPHVHPPGWVSQRAPGKGVCDDRCLQLPAATIGVHEAWVQRGGRGTGKTEGAAHYVNAHAEGPACDTRVPGGHRFTIVAPTQPDAVSSCVTGVSGLQAINPGITVATTKEGTIVQWPNGAVGRVLGAHEANDVNRARAWTNVCVWWLEEAAAQPHLGGMLEQAPYTLRLGQSPHMVITTTPKNRPEVVALIEGTTDPDLQHVTQARVQTWGRTEDATRLPAPVRESYERLYRGTTRGLQELDGELVGDVEGALWVQTRPLLVDGLPNPDDRPGLDNNRVPAGSVGWDPHGPLDPEAFPEPVRAEVATVLQLLTTAYPIPTAPTITGARRAVGVDPAGGATENGIGVVASAHDHGYVLADLSLQAGPDTWGKLAVLAYYYFGAEGIALERTFGGDQPDFVIATAAEALGLPQPPLLRAATVEGKKQRAMPLVGLSQQARFHTVGRLPLLESEQTTWVEEDTKESPNRLDAMVHAARHLLVRSKPATVSSPTRGRSMPTAWASGNNRR